MDVDNKKYKSVDGSLYSKDGKTVYHLCKNEKGEIKIEKGTVTIKEISFSEKVEALYLSDSVTKRSGERLMINNVSKCKRAAVPKKFEKSLKYLEKYMGIIFY